MQSSLARAAFFGSAAHIERVYAQNRRAQVESLTDCAPGVYGAADLGDETLARTEVIFSTWGMPVLSAEQLKMLPCLRAVFYAAGSVQAFARPVLEREITLVSAWAANAVPVAQWTLAQVLLANKGFHRNAREFTLSRGRTRFAGRGNFGAPVAVLGAGANRALGHRTVARVRVAGFGVRPVFERGPTRATRRRKSRVGRSVRARLTSSPTTSPICRRRWECWAARTSAQLPAKTRAFINTGRGATARETEMIEVLATAAPI